MAGIICIQIGLILIVQKKYRAANLPGLWKGIDICPTRPGNAPTFKEDGTPVEIHHRGQNPEVAALPLGRVKEDPEKRDIEQGR